MSNYKNLIKVNAGTERTFGIVFAILFFLIGLYPLISSGEVRLWSLVLAIILILVSILKPGILYLPNKLWFKFGIALGTILSPIVLALIYFIAVFPTGIIMKLLGKDILKLKLDKKETMLKYQWVVSSLYGFGQ